MIFKFTTKRDINGNRYTLKVNTDNKSFIIGYNTARCYDDYIIITKTYRRNLAAQLENEGYKRIEG